MKTQGVLWEGAHPNLKEKQRFTLKISLACKAGAWGVPVFSSRSLPAGKPVVFCTCLQAIEGLEGFFFLRCLASLLDIQNVTISPLRGWICRSHSKKSKLHLKELPYWTGEAGLGWRRSVWDCVGSPYDTGKPTSQWAPESALFAAHPRLACLPGGWSSENHSSRWESFFLSLLATMHLV